MKILMINSVCGIGSTGRICTDLASELENNGHSVKIAYGRGDVPERFQRFATHIGTDLDVFVHMVKARLFDLAGYGSKRATEKFINWMREFEPDIIHIHNLHGYYLHIPTLFYELKISQQRIVWTLHDTWAFSGHSGTCDKVSCTKWKTGCGKCPLIRQYPFSIFDRSKFNWNWKREIFNSLDRTILVTPSIWLREQVKSSILKNMKIRVIPNGIDTDQFVQKETNIKKKLGIQDKIVLLGVSSVWHKYKGLYDFYRLNEIIDRKKYVIVLVGLDEKQRKKIPEGILALPKTTSIKQLVDYYNMADIFINLTYCDVFGMVNLEALSCNTPVITYDTGGTPETVLEYGGIVVQKGCIEKVKKAIEEIHINKIQVKKIKELREKYGKNSFTNNYINVYEDIIKNNI